MSGHDGHGYTYKHFCCKAEIVCEVCIKQYTSVKLSCRNHSSNSYQSLPGASMLLLHVHHTPLEVGSTLVTCCILDWLLRKPSSAGEGSLFCLGETDVKLSCPEPWIALPRLDLLSKIPATAVTLLPAVARAIYRTVQGTYGYSTLGAAF